MTVILPRLRYNLVTDRMDAHNQFRRLMLRYHAPQKDGKPSMPPIAKTDWFAYQLNRPDLGRAVVVSIRRDESPFDAATHLLRGLCAEATYAIEDADTGIITSTPGGDDAEGWANHPHPYPPHRQNHLHHADILIKAGSNPTHYRRQG